MNKKIKALRLGRNVAITGMIVEGILIYALFKTIMNYSQYLGG